jgi:hypothetical protein
MTGVSPRSALHRSEPLPKNIAVGLLSANIEFTANELEPQLAAVRFPFAPRA